MMQRYPVILALVVGWSILTLRSEEHNVRSDVAQGEYATAGALARRFSLREMETPDLFTADGEPCAVHYLMARDLLCLPWSRF